MAASCVRSEQNTLLVCSAVHLIKQQEGDPLLNSALSGAPVVVKTWSGALPVDKTWWSDLSSLWIYNSFLCADAPPHTSAPPNNLHSPDHIHVCIAVQVELHLGQIWAIKEWKDFILGSWQGINLLVYVWVAQINTFFFFYNKLSWGASFGFFCIMFVMISHHMCQIEHFNTSSSNHLHQNLDSSLALPSFTFSCF